MFLPYDAERILRDSNTFGRRLPSAYARRIPDSRLNAQLSNMETETIAKGKVDLQSKLSSIRNYIYRIS